MRKFSAALLFFLLVTYASYAQPPELWGTMSTGGSFGIGGIIKINGDGTGFANEYTCMGGSSGGSIQSTLLPVTNTLIYGNSVSGGSQAKGDIFSYNPVTNVYTMLFSMDTLSGYYPRGTVIKATNNKLYGLTNNGGTFNKGVFYSFDPGNNQYTKLHEFDGPTGQLPAGSVMQAAVNGKLYGMTTTGGANGSGVIFSYDIPSGQFAVVHHFSFSDGFSPFGNLMQGANGLLYGMAFGGGAGGYGVVFSFNTVGNVQTVIHNFNGTDGAAPLGSLIESGGVLYGTTSQGGLSNKGVLFKFEISGNVFSKLFDLTVATGCSPNGNLMMASDGKLYGMTLNGGTNNMGTIFSINTSGSTFSKIYDGNFATGALPYADLIEFSVSTSLTETNENTFPVSLYPNPSDGEITIAMEDFKEATIFTLTNYIGQECLKLQLTNASTQCKLNVPPGIYFFTIGMESNRRTGKLVVR